MVLVDAANVIGSRPTGWWRDRAGAADRFVVQIRGAVREGRLSAPVVVVLEGAARGGVEAGIADGVTVVHAPGSGDETLIAVIGDTAETVTLVSADRELCQRARALGADTAGPTWLIELMDGSR